MKLQADELEAAEAEDFDKAGQLTAEFVMLEARLKSLQEQEKTAESALSTAVGTSSIALYMSSCRVCSLSSLMVSQRIHPGECSHRLTDTCKSH